MISLKSQSDDIDTPGIVTRVVFAAGSKIDAANNVVSILDEKLMFQVSKVSHLTGYLSFKSGQASRGVLGELILTNYQFAFRGYRITEVHTLYHILH